MKKQSFNHMLALATTVALVSGSQTVYAQNSADSLEEVLVTGFRASLQNSLAAKREATSVVEAVYAEDIGKLPDSSIAETLARLPGLAGERRDGRTSGISVRGFNENYVASTLNGRELLGIGDNRGVEYDLYPSEIIAGAMIYKTAQANRVNQGLGGNVDLQTVRPLDSQRILNFNATFEQNGLKSANPDFDDKGHRLAFTYADKFADDTLGFAVTLASLESPSQEEQFRSWGYPDDSNGNAVLGGQDSFVRSAEMKRDTIAVIGQFEPNDSLSITADAMFIDFEEIKVKRGLEEGFAWGGGTTNTSLVSEDGFVTEGRSVGFNSVIRNDAEVKDGELSVFGVNTKYQFNDNWSANLDLSHSKSEKDLMDIESYSGVGRAGSPTALGSADVTWVMTSKGAMFTELPSHPNYTDPNIIRLAGPQGWGGALGPFFKDAAGENRTDAQDGFVNNPRFEEELSSFKLEVEGDVNLSIINGVKFGVNYSDRSKSKVNYGAFLISPSYFTADGLNWDFANGEIPFALTTAGDSPIPAEYVVGTANLDFIGRSPIIAYNGVGLYRSGYYKEFSAQLVQADRLGDTYSIDEKVLTTFAMAEFESGIMTGDVGLQIVNTDQSSDGFTAVVGGLDGLVDATAVTGSSKYTHLLPSLNLNFQVADDQVLRFGTGKAISRARMDDLRSNNSINFDFDYNRRTSSDRDNSAWSQNEGNSELRPYESINYDLSYEYYFVADGFLSATYFYKQLLNWHRDTNSYMDFTSYYIPGYHDAGINPPDTFQSFEGISNKVEESGSGYIQGTEIQASIPFHILSDSLDGLGIIASATFLDGEIRAVAPVLAGGQASVQEVVERIPGLSKESLQLTIYYERAGFEFRVSGRKRSSFLTEERGISLSLVPATDLGATLIDAQIGYDFSESGISALDGLSVRLQVQNLTDEDTVLTDGVDSRHVVRYQSFGTNYLLGLNYKF